VRKFRKVPPCQMQPVSAHSRMDSLLPNAEPTCGAGSTSVITHLRKREKCCAAAVRKRGEKHVKETDTKVSEEGGGVDAPGVGSKTPLQPMERTMVTQVVPLQPREDHSGAAIHPAAYGGPHTAAGTSALKDAASHGEEAMLEQVFCQEQ